MTTVESPAPRTGSHDVIDPSILYFGTPVIVISTVSDAGAVNLMPMSSSYFLGHTGVLGIGSRSQTYRNLVDTGECVLNMASTSMVTEVDRLALTTGRDPVPERKAAVGYRYVADKFAHAGLTPADADLVRPPRIRECPINLEALVVGHHDLGDGAISFQVEVVRIHVHPAIRMAGTEHRIDPDAWRPLIMSFQRFYGLGAEVHPSRLATINEEWYR